MNWNERYLREASLKGKLVQKAVGMGARAVGVPKSVAQGLGAAAGGLTEGQSLPDAIQTGVDKTLQGKGLAGTLVQKGLRSQTGQDLINRLTPQHTEPQEEL